MDTEDTSTYTRIQPSELKSQVYGWKDYTPSSSSSIPPQRFRNLPCPYSSNLSHNPPSDRSMTTIRLAFYYRIFPILRFRRICIWVAHFSWVYMVSIDLTIIFQWHVDSASLLSRLQLMSIVIPFITPGIASVLTCKVTASTSIDSSSVAAPSIALWISWYSYSYVPVIFHHHQDYLLILRQPIPLLFRLRTTVKQQIVLTALFTLAGLYVPQTTSSSADGWPWT